jgi:hypothetical protein
MLLVAGMLIVIAADSARAFDPEETFRQGGKVISLEGALAHFGSRLPAGDIQAWNLGARISLLPFGVTHFKRLRDIPDGVLELGLEPIFERLNTKRQNFGGLAFEFRYYLTHLRYGRLVPWIAASIAPGGSDLDIGSTFNDTRLGGPFMALIRGEVGVAYFITDETAVYMGLQAQHLSNGGFNGETQGGSQNADINTPWGGVVGVSRYFP